LPLLGVAVLIVVGTLLQLRLLTSLVGRSTNLIAAGDRRGLTVTMLLLLGAYVGGWATSYGEFYTMAIVGNRAAVQTADRHLDG
jgi:hypothetical protein